MTTGVHQIGADSIIEDVLTASPLAALVFIRWRMHCVGCSLARFETIAEACQVYCRPVDSFVAELQAAADESGGSFTAEAPPALE